MIPGSGRSPGEGKGYPFQYSGLENSMDCIVQGVVKSWTQLSDFHFHTYIVTYSLSLSLSHTHTHTDGLPRGSVVKNPLAMQETQV